MNVNSYLKFLVASLTAVGVALQTAYPADHWSQAIVAGVGAVLVYLVPNSPKGGGLV